MRKSAEKYGKKKKAQPQSRPYDKSWAVVGIDASMTSIAGVLMAYDGVLDRMRGPGVNVLRFTRDTHLLDRLAAVVKAENFIHDLMSDAGPFDVPHENVWIGVEEAWPAGLVKKADSQWLRQQAMMVGALIAGLSRYGYTHVYEVNNQLWKNIVREETGISKPDKWDVKTWAMTAYGLPDFPDLINSTKHGIIPRPEKSKAKPYQPDDIYDAAGVLAWMEGEHDGQV